MQRANSLWHNGIFCSDRLRNHGDFALRQAQGKESRNLPFIVSQSGPERGVFVQPAMPGLGWPVATMHIIDRLLQPPYQGQGSIVDTLALTWEQRCKSRQRLVTRRGREVALALPTGTQLRAGDLLPTPEGLITVEYAAEDVLRIRPRGPQETAFVAYQVGNRHLPLEIDAEGLKTLYEAVFETYLMQHAIPTERLLLPFSPVTAMSGHRHR